MTAPILFIGSGISQRYFQGAPTWKQLLTRIIKVYCPGRAEEHYIDLAQECHGDYMETASKIEVEFEAYCKANRYGDMKDLCDRYYSSQQADHQKHLSFMKVFMAGLFSKLELREDVEEELDSFRSMAEKITSIITTNYDTLIEDTLGFAPLIGNKIILSNPYNSVYKIHGCCKSAHDIIITRSDYDRFKQKYELIRAELISLFCHNPIIFLGYSVSDENIKEILRTIYRYVDPNSALAEDVRRNFLLVSYLPGSDNLELQPYSIQIEEGHSIEVHQLRTDNFRAVYDILASANYRTRVRDMKQLKSIIEDIATGDGPELMIENDYLANNVKRSSLALAVASKLTLRSVFTNAKDLINNYFSYMDRQDAKEINFIDKLNIAKKQFFPVYGFLCYGARSHKEGNKLKGQQVNRLKDAIKKCGYTNNYSTIREIFSAPEISNSSKENAILYGFAVGNISVDDLSSYLRSYPGDKSTSYNRLLCLYDYLSYCPEKEKQALYNQPIAQRPA